jgi:hypothetical protein
VLNDLPGLVQRHLERSLPDGVRAPHSLRITQQGEMWQRRGGRALRFSATQRFEVDRIAFSWRARFPIFGPLALRVVDEYAAGKGRLEARLLGVPVQRQSGPDTAAGEALRYLAELPWVPFAMAHNPELEWRELGAHTVEVATSLGAQRLALELRFNAAADIVGAFSPARPRLVGKRALPTPWTAEFGGYGMLGGIRAPTRAEVRWELPEGPFVYWRGTVTSLDLDRGDTRREGPSERGVFPP